MIVYDARNVDGIQDGKMRDDRRREERARAIINPEKDSTIKREQ